MTHQNNYTFADEIFEKGLEAVPEMMRMLINQAMQVERSKYLQAEQYERTEKRLGHANGFKAKTMKTRMGEITFAIPQVREGGFYPAALEKGLRSERALTMTLAEMYVQGVSTRRVKAITERLCGFPVSSEQVSRATAQLDEVLHEWRERPLGAVSYLYVDARYEKVREAGQVRDAAVLVASGITPEGERQILGVSVSLSEHETHWKAFLKGLKDRGLNGVKLVISDDHEGLGAARRAIFGSVPWQRCQFHLQQNAGAYLPKQTMRLEVAAEIRSMFNTSDRKTAEELLSATRQKYAFSAPGIWQLVRRTTWQKGLQSLDFRLITADLSGPLIVWRESIKRYVDGQEWSGFSQMRQHASGWFPLYLWRSVRSGRSENIIVLASH